MRKLVIGAVLIGGIAFFIASKCRQKAELFTYPDNVQWGKAKADPAIRPFTVQIDKKVIEDLKERLVNWRQHESMEGVGYSYGLSGKPLDKLVKYWRDKYDWSKAEAKLNTLPQFTTVIQGLKIHFIHAKADAKAKKRIPILMVHGWPGSVVEFYRAIPLLTAVDKNGTAFDIIAPSIPGYGFSDAASKPGFNPIAAAQVFHTLMKRLGYEKFVYQGGDWGSVIGALLSRIYPDSVIGFHTNLPQPPMTSVCDQIHLVLAKIAPKLFVEEGGAAKLEKLDFGYILEETGYFHEQCTKPDTLGVALSDSPVGLAAWIVEKFIRFSENAEVKGDPAGKGISNDDLLTNVMIYWVTNHATSAGRLYKEMVQTIEQIQAWDSQPYAIPTGAACYPFEVLCSPKALLKNRMPKLVHFTDPPRGGHFAAFEEPQLFASDVRAAVNAFVAAREKEQQQAAKKGNYQPASKQPEPKKTATTAKTAHQAAPTTTAKPVEVKKEAASGKTEQKKPETPKQTTQQPKTQTTTTSQPKVTTTPAAPKQEAKEQKPAAQTAQKQDQKKQQTATATKPAPQQDQKSAKKEASAKDAPKEKSGTAKQEPPPQKPAKAAKP